MTKTRPGVEVAVEAYAGSWQMRAHPSMVRVVTSQGQPGHAILSPCQLRIAVWAGHRV